jgi:hypothetical protein
LKAGKENGKYGFKQKLKKMPFLKEKGEVKTFRPRKMKRKKMNVKDFKNQN